MKVIKTDIAIIGAGGAGLRAAIEISERYPHLKTALIAKVYPMRSHTCAAEGGAAGVKRDDDKFEYHFNDTVSGADWLADQDVVEYFVKQAPLELTQLERWGCPWSRKDDGSVNVRRFGGMKIQRTWFAADKTGFHILHTLFQTSVKHLDKITRFDEYFVFDLIEHDGRCQGALAIEIATGETVAFIAKSVILATGGAGRVYPHNTNGGIVTGDGMSIAYRHGVPLCDMEFVQYHPTGLPGTGILMTEGCRGEGGLLTNKDGYRYLQDYGLGPVTDQPKNKYMELGPRDRLSQAFWQEEQKGRTIDSSRGSVVNLDLRHLGEKYLQERLPFICELAKAYVGIDPAKDPIPVRPVAHYTMGGVKTNAKTETALKGLYAVGECASVGIHGANRLGSNSLTELLVFGKLAGKHAAENASSSFKNNDESDLMKHAEAPVAKIQSLVSQSGSETMASLKKEMTDAMENGIGIYRTQEGMQQAVNKISELKERFKKINLSDKSKVFNTEWLYAIELGHLLDVADAMANSAINRNESRGSHQRLDNTERDDANFLKHTLAYYSEGSSPKINYEDVVITSSQPAKRAYGAEGDK